MTFDIHIGIDYSGRETPLSRTLGLQVYSASGPQEPQAIRTPKAAQGANWNWCRKEIAEWLIDQARGAQLQSQVGWDSGARRRRNGVLPERALARLGHSPCSELYSRDRTALEIGSQAI